MQSVSRFAFPPVCVGCGKPDQLLCRHCQSDILWVSAAFCPGCLTPVNLSDGRCCHSLPDTIYSAVSYIGPIPKAIHHLKYQGHFAVAKPLAQLMISAWQSAWQRPEMIVPIPLHKSREQKRSYNQAALLAQEISAEWSIQSCSDALIRIRSTRPQVGLNAHERQNNVINAFWANPSFKGKSVLLVDDVFTTGATMQAAAMALIKAGASSVAGFTLAKAEMDY